MSIRAIQSEFSKHSAQLVIWMFENGFEATEGDSYRPTELQEIYVKTGRSLTMNTLHGKRLARDFNIFVNGQLCYDKAKLAPVGAYWESLHPNNSWGGNGIKLVDTPHFSRGVDKPEFRRVS